MRKFNKILGVLVATSVVATACSQDTTNNDNQNDGHEQKTKEERKITKESFLKDTKKYNEDKNIKKYKKAKSEDTDKDGKTYAMNKDGRIIVDARTYTDVEDDNQNPVIESIVDLNRRLGENIFIPADNDGEYADIVVMDEPSPARPILDEGYEDGLPKAVLTDDSRIMILGMGTDYNGSANNDYVPSIQRALLKSAGYDITLNELRDGSGEKYDDIYKAIDKKRKTHIKKDDLRKGVVSKDAEKLNNDDIKTYISWTSDDIIKHANKFSFDELVGNNGDDPKENEEMIDKFKGIVEPMKDKDDTEDGNNNRESDGRQIREFFNSTVQNYKGGIPSDSGELRITKREHQIYQDKFDKFNNDKSNDDDKPKSVTGYPSTIDYSESVLSKLNFDK